MVHLEGEPALTLPKPEPEEPPSLVEHSLSDSSAPYYSSKETIKVVSQGEERTSS